MYPGKDAVCLSALRWLEQDADSTVHSNVHPHPHSPTASHMLGVCLLSSRTGSGLRAHGSRGLHAIPFQYLYGVITLRDG